MKRDSAEAYVKKKKQENAVCNQEEKLFYNFIPSGIIPSGIKCNVLSQRLKSQPMIC